MNAIRTACGRLLCGILLLLFPSLAGAVIVGEYSVAPLNTSTATAGVAVDADGNAWLTAVVPNRIGRIHPSGIVTEFPVSGFGMLTGGITAGPDGNIWFTKEFNGAIMRMTPQGAITEFPIGIDSPRNITVGPDGNLWFTGGYQVGRITPAGVATLVPLSDAFTHSITAGPDGNLWFTGRRFPAAVAVIGRVTPAGTVTLFELGRDGVPTGITPGPDGNLWFTFDTFIGRITPAGVFTLFSYPLQGSTTSIATGPDGNLWFTDYGNSKIGRITTSGQYLAFLDTPSAISAPQAIATGPDGLIWFYESNTNNIGVISQANIANHFPLSAGATWSYAASGGAFPFTRTVIAGTTSINGVNTTLLRDSDGFGIYATNDANGIRVHRQADVSDTITFSPPITYANAATVLGAPTFGNGIASAVISGTPVEVPYTSSSLIQAIENVTLPAGTFRAARIQFSINLPGGTVTETDWVANGVGLVQMAADADNFMLTATNLTVTVPDIFGYTVPAAAPPITRNTFTVTGITAAVPISITGGEYSIDGGAYTAAAGTVTNGQSVTVRPLSLLNALVKQAVVTIGGVTGVFNALVPTAPAVDLSPASLAFGGQMLGTTSAVQEATLANSGNATLTISSITVSGDFAQTNTCGAALAPGASCAIDVSFTPMAAGARTGLLSISSDAAGSPHTVALSGTGVEPDIQAPSVPGGLSATSNSWNAVSLSWNGATDNVGVTLYQVFSEAVLRATVNAAATSFTDTGLTAETTYSYTVAACDAAGNCSAQSASASATTQAAGTSSFTANLVPGFNLLGNSLNLTLDVATLFGNQDAPTAITPNIVSIWKWNAVDGRWAFYSPQLTVSGIASFAASKGYEVLATINPGEGYWVNATGAMTLPTQTGIGSDWTAINFAALPSGFNLIAHASTLTPSQFNIDMSTTPPAPGTVPTDNFVSLWAWDPVETKWYFYSPLLEASGGLPAVKSYADNNFYLHFEDYGKTLGLGTGFWVNRP